MSKSTSHALHLGTLPRPSIVCASPLTNVPQIYLGVSAQHRQDEADDGSTSGAVKHLMTSWQEPTTSFSRHLLQHRI